MHNDSQRNTHWGISELRNEIDRSLATFLEQNCKELTAIGTELIPAAEALREFTLNSGKRFRPLLATLGFMATGEELTPPAITTLSSLELVHVCALMHDDVMDQSDARRGAPTIHRHFEALHKSERLNGDSELYGVASAILLGDLALVWAASMARSSYQDLHTLKAFLSDFDLMQTELMAGQFLDIHEQTLTSRDVERSLKVARFKSAKYSIERPLHLGVSLALPHDPGRASELQRHFTNVGLPLGEAFQLRDDLLGVFGESAETGKPVGDDLREGKNTALLALAHKFANPAQKELLEEKVGRADLSSHDIERLQRAIDDSGALAEVENLIATRTEESLRALKAAPITEHAADLLGEMVLLATSRKS